MDKIRTFYHGEAIERLPFLFWLCAGIFLIITISGFLAAFVLGHQVQSFFWATAALTIILSGLGEADMGLFGLGLDKVLARHSERTLKVYFTESETTYSVSWD